MTILPVLISLFLSAKRTINIINFDEKDLLFFSVHAWCQKSQIKLRGQKTYCQPLLHCQHPGTKS